MKYWYVAQAYHVGKDLCNQLDKLPFEYFAPMQQKSVVVHGKQVKRDVPLTLNYVFFRTDDFLALQAAVRNFSKVHLLYRMPSKDAKKDSHEARFRPMTASDREMEMFMKAASFYTQGAPLTIPDKAQLSKGDTVRIIDGPFKGVEGILASHQGKDGGKVIVSISNLLAISTIDIAPENLEVIRFAHGNKHIYKKMDAFKPRVEKALQDVKAGEPLTDEVREQIETFIRRFSATVTDTVNTEAKLNLLIFQGYQALQMTKEARRYYLRLRDEILPKVKAEKMRHAISQALQQYL